MTRGGKVARAVAVTATLWLVACGDDAPPRPAGRTTSTSAPSTREPTSTTSTLPAGEATLLTDDDAVLVGPEGGRPVAIDPGDPCAVLARGGSCDRGEDLVWVTATGPAGRSPVTVYAVEGDRASPVLAVERESRAEYASARVEAADLDGRAGTELVVALRNAGTGGLLQIDVVGGTGAVVAHLTLDRGRAELDGSVLRTWSARYRPDDPNCCPSRFAQARVAVDGDRWQSVEERDIPADDVPSGDFP